MNRLVTAGVFLTCVTILSGCASTGSRIVLDRVGPSPRQERDLGLRDSHGAIIVYTAFAVTPGSVDRRQFSDYRILSENGTSLKWVVNDTNKISRGDPTRVELPAGLYRIVADSFCCGNVIVPVRIIAGRVTKVYLAGSSATFEGKALNESNPVRLPNGEVVGWRANDHDNAQP